MIAFQHHCFRLLTGASISKWSHPSEALPSATQIPLVIVMLENWWGKGPHPLMPYDLPAVNLPWLWDFSLNNTGLSAVKSVWGIYSTVMDFSKWRCEFSLWSKGVSESWACISEKKCGAYHGRHWSLFYYTLQQGKLDKGNYSSVKDYYYTCMNSSPCCYFLCCLSRWHLDHPSREGIGASQLISNCTVSPLWKVIFQTTNVYANTPARSIICWQDLCPCLLHASLNTGSFFNASTHNWAPRAHRANSSRQWQEETSGC